MMRRALSSPQYRTGLLCQSGWSFCASWRNATRRGQSGQSRGGWVSTMTGWTRVGLLVLDGHGCAFGMPFGRRRALRRRAAHGLCELGNIEEEIGLAAQIIGD